MSVIVCLMSTEPSALDGGCSCGEIRYQLLRAPLFVHCCHCTRCQRETGSAFALNALIESSEVKLLQGRPSPSAVPTRSGKGQTILRCRTCCVAVWSHYGAGGAALSFVRVGSLDDSSRIAPSIHIYTTTKQPWVILPADIPAVEEYYRGSDYWPSDSLTRASAMRAR